SSKRCGADRPDQPRSGSERSSRSLPLRGWCSVPEPSPRFGCPFSASPVESRRTGRSAAWLARVPWEHEVASSNLAAPTLSWHFRDRLRDRCAYYGSETLRTDGGEIMADGEKKGGL